MARSSSNASLLALALVAALVACALASGASAAAPTTTTACLLTASVQPNASAYALSGSVTKPVPGALDAIDLTASGLVYLALPSVGGACPKLTVDNAGALLAQATLAQPRGAPGVALNPRVIMSSVLSTSTDSPASPASSMKA